MKKIFLILILNIFAAEALAQDYKNQGIVEILVEEDLLDRIEISAPKIVTKFILDAGFDDNYQATNRQDEYKDTYAKVRLINNFRFKNGVSINSYLTLDRIDNSGQTSRRSAAANGGGDRSFENLGAYAQELNITFSRKNYDLLAGKFTLNFGNAWRWNRGIWIQDIADNYKQKEKLGFFGVYRAGNAKKTGQYNFSLSGFTNDRKNLDNSLMVQRDSAHKSDAVPGDTRSLQSYNASLDINFDFGEKEKLSYHFSYLDLAINERATSIAQGKVENQTAAAFGMNYKYPLLEKLLLDGSLEYVEVKNVGGNSDIGDRYLTASLIGRFYDNWNVLLGNSSRRNLYLGQNGYDQNLSEISLGYEFKNHTIFDKLTIQAGYKNFRTNYKTSLETKNSLGLLVRYYKNF